MGNGVCGVPGPDVLLLVEVVNKTDPVSAPILRQLLVDNLVMGQLMNHKTAVPTHVQQVKTSYLKQFSQSPKAMDSCGMMTGSIFCS